MLFFEKGAPTLRQDSGQASKIWYYQFNPSRNLGKTNPLTEKDLAEFVELQKTKADSENSWSVDVGEIHPGKGGIDPKTFDLSVNNPNRKNENELREPTEILRGMEELDKDSKEIIKKIEEVISSY